MVELQCLMECVQEISIESQMSWGQHYISLSGQNGVYITKQCCHNRLRGLHNPISTAMTLSIVL